MGTKVSDVTATLLLDKRAVKALLNQFSTGIDAHVTIDGRTHNGYISQINFGFGGYRALATIRLDGDGPAEIKAIISPEGEMEIVEDE